eukprot:s145_g10.t1
MGDEDVALMKITAKKNVAFYMRAAASFLRGTEDKKPVQELRVTALGEAIGIVASVASRCEKESLATIKEIKTDYADVQTNSGTTRGCAQLQALQVREGGAAEYLLRCEGLRGALQEQFGAEASLPRQSWAAAASLDGSFADLPQVQHALSLRFAASCDQAGGQKVVLGAAAAGWTGGLYLGTLLWSGESPQSLKRLADAIELAHQRNRTAAVRTKLRRGLRRRLLITSAASGTGLVARASGVARRMGLAATAFQTKLMEKPPLAVGRSQRALASDTQELVLMEPLREKGVALLTLNRPKALNALSDGLMRALAEKLQQVDGDSTLRAAVDANLSDLLVLEGWLQQPLLVYFINTDSSTARRAHIEQQAKNLGLPLQRFRRSGLDPLLLSSGPDRSMNGTVACFVSHASLMEQIARNYSGDRVALILEDDVLLPTDLLRRVRHVLECAPPDWSLLKVSSWGAMRQSNFVRPLRTLWQSLSFQLRGVLTMLGFQDGSAGDVKPQLQTPILLPYV